MNLNFQRFRPLRATPEVRQTQADVQLTPDQLIVPLFVIEGQGQKRPIASLPAVYHFSIDQLVLEANRLWQVGLTKVLLFGVIPASERDAQASGAYRPDNLVARAVRAIKTANPAVQVFTDVCLCAYTDHGHCGLIQGQTILNDETLPLLAAMAVTHAQAGADWVAPSAMMDGQVAAIRSALDAAGSPQTAILSYSAKFASGLYGPFRDAAASSPSFGDRRSYQMDYHCSQQPIDEVAADWAEGAQAVMVKPALAYLDVLSRLRQRYPQATIAAYHVSGEYMMVQAAAQAGYMDAPRVFEEHLTAIRRAGADWIITYAAEQWRAP